MKRKIEDRLLELGITPNLRGFRCITDAVIYILENEGCLLKEIYGEVSKINHFRSWQNSERVIRHAISKVDEVKWEELGGKGLKNSEFLFTLAFILKKEQ